ncbi:MAG: response regulator [Deltaproteobacteria bacterium]|nr:response regulator [Deltaproteobacteria bacterium]
MTPSEKSIELRRKAERALQQADKTVSLLQSDPIRELLTELQTYHIELELQNEELRITQAALENSRRRYIHLFENAPVGYLRLDRKGRILSLNQKMLQLADKTHTEMVGKPFASFLTEKDEKQFRSIFQSLRQAPEKKPLELKLQRSEKSILDIRIEFARDLYDEAKAENPDLLVTVSDITESKEVQRKLVEQEHQLRHAQKMEAIGHLAGGIAHDFNNIIAAILGYADLTLLEPDLDENTRDHLKQILCASERAKELVRRILTFGRPEKTKQQTIFIGKIIEESVHLLRGATPPSISIQLDISQEQSPVDADPTAIHEIIMNLATNALHALGEKGTLQIRLIEQTLATPFAGVIGKSDPGIYTVIQIADSGKGMTQEVLEQIFDPYFTTRINGSGSGMGLAVVYGIVRQLGGNIIVESQLRRGSVFKIFLPQSKQRRSTYNNPDAAIMLCGGTERVLLVDDEEMLVYISKRILEGYGYHVDGYTSPEEALSTFYASPDSYNLLITDQAMPLMTGLELAQRIREVKSIPVLLCTGYQEATSSNEQQRVGISAVCKKPFRKEKLAQTVRTILDQWEDRG